MPTNSLSISTSVAGFAISGTLQRTGPGTVGNELTLAAGNAGSLTTRTDNDTGTITATSTSHDIATSDVVDVYWGSGSTAGIRRGMTVGTVSGTSIPIDGGAGDNLPTAATAVVVDKQETLNTDFTGSEVILAGASSQYRGSIHFTQGDGTSVLGLDLAKSGTDGEAWGWANYTAVSNPFGAAVGLVKVSNGNSSFSNTVVFGVLLDNDS